MAGRMPAVAIAGAGLVLLVVLLVAAQAALDDPHDWVRREVETALAAPGVRVVPVLLDGAKMPDATALPAPMADLAGRNAVTVDADEWEAGLDELIASIKAGNLAERLRESTEVDSPQPQ